MLWVSNRVVLCKSLLQKDSLASLLFALSSSPQLSDTSTIMGMMGDFNFPAKDWKMITTYSHTDTLCDGFLHKSEKIEDHFRLGSCTGLNGVRFEESLIVSRLFSFYISRQTKPGLQGRFWGLEMQALKSKEMSLTKHLWDLSAEKAELKFKIQMGKKQWEKVHFRG